MKNCLSIYIIIAVLSLASGCHMTIPEDHFNIRNKMVKGDSLHVYSTLDEPVGSKFNENKTYYSVRFGEIRTLQGGVDGEPLQGVYELYFKKKLTVKGGFRNGLKNGKWFEWSSDGILKSVTNYQSGVLQGPFREFDDDGNIRFEAKYRRGRLHGLARIVEDDQSKTLKYKNGLLIDTLNSDNQLFKWLKKKKETDDE